MTPQRADLAVPTLADGNPLGTPGEHKHHTKKPARLTMASLLEALPLAVRKLGPRQMVHSPVMFTVLAGAVLCWARALGEFGATITFAGNLPGRTQTMPTAIYVLLETNPEDAIAVSLVLLVVSLVVLVALRHRWLGAL